jgi:hypothetical protein
MLIADEVNQNSQRKYLLVSKDLWSFLKGYGKHEKITLGDITEHLLLLGIKRSKELYMKEVIRDLMRPRPDGLKYVISQPEKKYLVVSQKTHNKVTEFARKRKIKLIDATRYLLGFGILAHFNADPRKDPQYTSLMEINQLIIERWQKNNPGKSIEKVFGPLYREKMEADILQKISFPIKEKPSTPKRQRSKLPNKTHSMDLGLRDLIELALIFGGSFLLVENMKLRNENQELRRLIAGGTTKDGKHSLSGNSFTVEKHKNT